MMVLGAVLSGFLFASMISFADSLTLRVLHIWFSRERKKIFNKWQTLFAGRSRCDVCRYPIRPLHIIPIFGFFLAGGKCSNCATPIPLRHPILEIIFFFYGGILFLLVPPTEVVAVACALPALAVLAVIDFRYYLIPDATLAWLLVLALVEMFLLRGDVFALERGRLLQPIALLDLTVPVSWFLVFHLIRILSGGRLGFADATLVLALGIGLGHRAALLLPTLAALLAIMVHGFRRLQAEKSMFGSGKIAFGPYLAVAALLLRLWP